MGGPPELEGVEHEFVDIGELRAHVAVAGPKDAPPVLLLHGWPQHWYMWRRVIEGLRGSYRVLAPDLRGFGWSGTPGHGYDSETFATDQIALLDALGIERADVIGHDWGGFTTFLLGIRHPSRVRRLVVCNSPPPWVRATPSLLPELWRTWYAVVNATPGVGAFAASHGFTRFALRHHGSDPDLIPEPEIATYTSRFDEPERARAHSLLYRSYLRVFTRALRGGYTSERLAAPTLLLFGAEDRMVTRKLVAGGEPYADEMRVEMVPGCGHFIVDERTELVIERARSHLAG
jgi:pimeloyl-ACP methyl ester carboxylesterase